MATMLNILHLEDNPTDAEFLRAKLDEAAIPCVIQVVQTRDEFTNAIDQMPYDLIISDFSLPSFDGKSALEIARVKCPETPFVFVSGTIGEDAAIEGMVRGATDYVLKSKNARLIPAIKRALEDAQARKLQKKANEDLKQERILLRTVIDNLPDAIYVKDLQGRKTLANLADLRNMGLQSEDEALGKDDFAFFPKALAEGFHADDMSVIRTGTPIVDKEEYFIDGDGQKHWLLTTKLPLRNQKGEITGLVGIGRDVTEQKKARESLKESKEKYQNLFESNLAATVASMPDGAILECNPAFVRLFGFASVEEAKSMNMTRLYKHSEDRDKLIRKIRSRWQVENQGISMVNKTGAPVDVIANVVGKFDDKHNLLWINSYMLDDTKRKSLEHQLIQAQKLESLGTLAGGIAHDFNNILGIIIGHSTIIERGRIDKEKVSQSISTITKAAQRGAGLVRQLLTFARKSDVLFSRVSLNDSVKELTSLLSQTLPKTITVSTELAQDLPLIYADATQIHQVLLNLSINARDAMPNGGVITIKTKQAKGTNVIAKFPKAKNINHVLVEVSDTGTGMDEETRRRIFEPFFTTKELGKGTGLGLSVVFGIMELHYGFIDLTTAPGKGTMFSLYFPDTPEVVEGGELKKDLSGEGPGGTETILLVEDEDVLKELALASMEGKGYHVLTASDGEQAVEIYRSHKKEIDLVVCDLGLPKIDGHEVLKQLLKINPSVKFILTSGYVEPDQKKTIFETGAKDFIQKPFVPNEMLNTIRNVLGEPRT
ncbi:MAG TPA: response regulator [Bacteroidota bacterium]|nr:response regulator [Bacteroidota bacterium]